MSDGVSLPPQIGPYRNRILGLRVMPAGELADNPRNGASTRRRRKRGWTP